jgi:hypothetical protein
MRCFFLGNSATICLPHDPAMAHEPSLHRRPTCSLHGVSVLLGASHRPAGACQRNCTDLRSNLRIAVDETMEIVAVEN